jgi:preprotein translocase subunit SecA
VAAAINSDPTLLARLEKAARQASPDLRPEEVTTIEKETGITGLDSSLLEHLRRTEPLADHVRLLVYFSPDTDETSTPG